MPRGKKPVEDPRVLAFPAPPVPETDTAIPVEAGQPDPPPFKIYVAYAWTRKKGNRSGYSARVFHLPIPDLTTEAHIQSVLSYITQNDTVDEVTILFWKALEE